MKSFAQLAFATALIVTPAFAQDAAAPAPASGEKVWHHGMTLIGELKYPEGFAHLDYVNPDAPKGGTVRMATSGTFDTLNPVPDKGTKAPTGGLIYESLLTHTLDETSTAYGLIAEALSYPDDYSSVTFRLDPAAKWWDGQPITTDDVIWSFETSIKLNKFRASYYANVEKVEATGEREVTFTFKEKGNRELPMIVGEFPILPKHWWEANDASGKPRNVAETSMEIPMGSGPYRLETVKPGTSLTYKRVEDYWAANKPTEVGTNNFDTLRYEYFRDLDVAFEAFKGDQFDYWSENRAARWATAYDFPAAKDGRVVRERYTEPMADSGVMVGFVYNLRSPKFQDVRVRRALNYAFDFEQLQKTLFYGEYDRVDSFFFRTELAAPGGPPTGEELDILNSVKDQVPPEVFTERYTNPVGGSENLRKNLGAAAKLLDEAGYVQNGTTRMTPDGQPFTVEIMLEGPTIEPVAENLVTNLGRIGIQVTIRAVDDAQYKSRMDNRDFELSYTGWGETLSPGNEQLDFWGSAAADTPNSLNYSGLKDPGVDALIQKVIYADDRETLIAATHALDRVLLAKQIIIPSYAAVDERVAIWNRFSHAKIPTFSVGFPTSWWWDAEKAAKTGGN